MPRRRINPALAAAALACAAAWCADPILRIPPVTTTVDVQGQPVRVTVAGDLFASGAPGGEELIDLHLRADLADFQQKLTPILAAQLNQANRCGERLTVLNATLAPAEPAALLMLTAHVEKWGCAKAFGKEIVKRLVGGDGKIGVRLTPQVENGAGVKLNAEVTSIDADGSLGEMLRSGPFADSMREKIRQTVVKAVERSTDFKTMLPAAAQQLVSIHEVRFGDGGEGRLALTVTSQARVPEREARELLEKLRAR